MKGAKQTTDGVESGYRELQRGSRAAPGRLSALRGKWPSTLGHASDQCWIGLTPISQKSLYNFRQSVHNSRNVPRVPTI